MGKKKKKREYKSYLEFLETRLNSENFLKNASEDEIAEAKMKYKREKLKQKLLNAKKAGR
jgi:hypothetical protein